MNLQTLQPHDWQEVTLRLKPTGKAPEKYGRAVWRFSTPLTLSVLLPKRGWHLYKQTKNYAYLGPPPGASENIFDINVRIPSKQQVLELARDYRAHAKSWSLINVSSILSLFPYPGGSVYSGTKGFVTNFTESLWYEFKGRGVYVMALLTGVTNTNFHAVATGGRSTAEQSGPCYPPEVVVKDALAALKARKSPAVISGPAYRLFNFLGTKLVSRKMMINFIGENSVCLKS